MHFCGACCDDDNRAVIEALDGYGGVGDNCHRLVEDPIDEALVLRDSVGQLHNVKGVLYTMTSAGFPELKKCIESLCEETGTDGSYLSEMQLRHRFYQHMTQQCGQVNGRWDDDSTFFSCGEEKGKCGVLPGDTVYAWDADDCGLYNFTHFEPATRDELIERGYYDHRFEIWASLFRREIRAKRTGDAGEEASAKCRRESLEKGFQDCREKISSGTRCDQLDLQELLRRSLFPGETLRDLGEHEVA